MSRAAYDSALLESARSGDVEATVALLTLAQPDIRRYARQSCRLIEDAEEAVQETLLILYRRVGTLRVAASFSGWLFAIVKRECTRLAKGLVKSPFRKVSLEDAEGGEDQDRFGRMPPQELRLDLARCIQSLPESYREIVLLRDVEEMTIEEINLRLGLTREAVKARLHRARKLMREYLMA
jgi:RNA polymerase sigma factor (sigma-70 family)